MSKTTRLPMNEIQAEIITRSLIAKSHELAEYYPDNSTSILSLAMSISSGRRRFSYDQLRTMYRSMTSYGNRNPVTDDFGHAMHKIKRGLIENGIHWEEFMDFCWLPDRFGKPLAIYAPDDGTGGTHPVYSPNN